MHSDLTELTATEAVGAMQRGDVSAQDYASALLTRCEARKDLNAFRTLQPERVLAAACDADQFRSSGAELGPLHGLPIPVKDSVNTKDYPTSGGTYALRNFVPDEDASLVRKLIRAGAFVLGKTNIHELSFGWTSNNLTFGAVHNPYDVRCIPGGSSGGTAAAVAAGMSPLGIAEDTLGSIRVPAALCGLYGFRPTTGRYPTDGVIPITPLFDQTGPHARAMSDLLLFDEVMTADSTSLVPRPLQGLRLGVPKTYYYDTLDSEVERVTNEALQKLSLAGAVLVEADLPNIESLLSTTTLPIELYHAVPMIKQYLERYSTGITIETLLDQAGADVRALFFEHLLHNQGGRLAEQRFVAARDKYLPLLKHTFEKYFRNNDVAAMIFPTTRITAPRIGQDGEIAVGGKWLDFNTAIAGNIAPGSTAGIPGLVLPTGLADNGLPVSIEIDGAVGTDRQLLGLGLEIEKVLGRIPLPGPTQMATPVLG